MMIEDDDDDLIYEGDYPDYRDLVGLVVTTTRISIDSPAPRGRVVGVDDLIEGVVCRCGCGPLWAVRFNSHGLDLLERPLAFFAHDLRPLGPLEQLAYLPEQDHMAAPDRAQSDAASLA